MKATILAAALIFSALAVAAQECTCPTDVSSDNDGRANKVFHFSNGLDVGICGYTAVETDTAYTKFTLFECATGKTIETWDVTRSCQAAMVKGELLLKEMFGLPIGQNFSTLWRPFLIHKYAIKNGMLQETEYFSKDLARYSTAQIKDVLDQYKNLTGSNNHSIMRVGSMLFWATVSGSKEAETALRSLPDKFGPFDGVVADEWKAIFGNYEKWKQKSTGK
jgi:hypothetical protein